MPTVKLAARDQHEPVSRAKFESRRTLIGPRDISIAAVAATVIIILERYGTHYSRSWGQLVNLAANSQRGQKLGLLLLSAAMREDNTRQQTNKNSRARLI